MYTLVVFSLSLSALFLSAEAQQCNATTLCPAAAPCCSEFGWCGSGSDFCLGGCNPFQSHTPDSCKPNPICKSTTYTFKDESRILMNSTLNDGDATKYDWTLDGGQVSVADGELSMLLTETNNGVRLSSTRYVHYGTITATMKTGRWNGVVAGFITMSDIRDEIDWEFPGAATTEGQTNYFWQGVVTAPNHGGVAKGLSDTYENYHQFTFVWSPESMIFQINGQTVRTIKQSDTVVNGVSQFPSTPSRIQLSLWPAGTSASAPGTIQWAGGLINWNDPDYKAAGGHFTAKVKSIEVKCADPTPPSASAQGYVYGGTPSKPTISFTDGSTVMGNTTSSGSSSGSSSSASLSKAATAPASSASASSAANGAPAASSVADSSPTVGNVEVVPSASASSSDDSGSASSSDGSDSGASVTPAPPSPSTTTLGDDAVSSAPASFSHDGGFFGNGGMDASSASPDVNATASAGVSVSASASGSDASASASGTPTQTEAPSSVSSSSASASASKSGSPNSAHVPRGLDGQAFIASALGAVLVGAALL